MSWIIQIRKCICPERSKSLSGNRSCRSSVRSAEANLYIFYYWRQQRAEVVCFESESMLYDSCRWSKKRRKNHNITASSYLYTGARYFEVYDYPKVQRTERYTTWMRAAIEWTMWLLISAGGDAYQVRYAYDSWSGLWTENRKSVFGRFTQTEIELFGPVFRLKKTEIGKPARFFSVSFFPLSRTPIMPTCMYGNPVVYG